MNPQRWVRGLLIALALTGLIALVTQPALGRWGADFTIWYSAALLVREGHPESVYDRERLRDKMVAVSGGAPVDPRIPVNKPLAVTFPILPLTYLPPEVAFRLWQVLTVGLLLTALVLLQRYVPLGPSAVPFAMLGMLAAPPTWSDLLQGQFGGLLLVGAVLLLGAAATGQVWLAALGGTLLALKPQYLPPYLILLWASRRAPAMLAGAAGGLLVSLTPLLAGGPAGLTALIRSQLRSGAELLPLHLHESWIGMLAPVLPPRAGTVAGVAIWCLSAVALLVLVRRRPAPFLAFGTLAGCVAVLASPFALPHDLVLLAAPAWLACGLHRAGQIPSPLPGFAATGSAVLADLHGVPVAVAPIALTAVLAAFAWAFRQRAAVRGAPPSQLAA